MITIRETVIRVLEKDDLRHEILGDDKNIVRTSLRLENALCRVRFVALEDLLLVEVASEMLVPKDRLPQAMEYVLRANYGLRVGGFDLDVEDRDWMFRASSLATAGVIGEDVVSDLFHHAVMTVDDYYPGLGAVCFGGKEPKAAIEEVERARPTDEADE